MKKKIIFKFFIILRLLTNFSKIFEILKFFLLFEIKNNNFSNFDLNIKY
jgi:hypothetical protein